ncbi:hypothetical protein MUK42_03316 [Musa troglodytarum]|uniref:Uncharacterized protein n=1 Tax=Musa troglodytarum TaxID=320322 RepID=A0A9E7KMP1_9LILI|nr:hypothetical protein MUK42_03316 [Musa troglodytarum]
MSSSPTVLCFPSTCSLSANLTPGERPERELNLNLNPSRLLPRPTTLRPPSPARRRRGRSGGRTSSGSERRRRRRRRSGKAAAAVPRSRASAYGPSPEAAPRGARRRAAGGRGRRSTAVR